MNKGVKTESERKYRSSHLTENFEDLIEIWDIDKCIFLRKSLRIPLRVISDMTGISKQSLSLCERHDKEMSRYQAICYTTALKAIIEHDNKTTEGI